MKFGTLMQFDHFTVPTIKNFKFHKSKLAAATILKNRKLTYVFSRLSNFDKI